MDTPLQVPPEQLRRLLDPSALPFETTEQVDPLAGTIGQPRALDVSRCCATAILGRHCVREMQSSDRCEPSGSHA